MGYSNYNLQTGLASYEPPSFPGGFSLAGSPVRAGLDIDWIGPEAPASGPGSESKDNVKKTTKIPGPKVGPARLSPPEIELSEERRLKLENYIWNELTVAEQERWDIMDRFARLKSKYRTKFPEFPKNFPIPNASQITIPIIKTNVNTLTARLHQTVMAAKPMASVRTRDDEYQDFANDWELFLDTYSEEKLDIEEIMDTAITECVKLGTSVIEVTRLLQKKKIVDFDSVGLTYTQKSEEVFNGPIVYNVPLEDFWIRPQYQDIQKAPWCGKEIRPSWTEIKDMAVSGEITEESLKYIGRFGLTGPGQVPKPLTQEQEDEDFKPNDWDIFRLFELCIRWDIDGDGIDEELMVMYDLVSRRLCRCKFNTFKKGRRPWEVFRYVKIEYRFYGEGMGDILEQLQEEISTQHNQRIDNATIASLKLVLTAKAIPGLRPGDALWPGKIVKARPEDVNVLTLGEIYPSTVQNEAISQNYVREVSGVGEAQLGGAQPVSRTTAAAQLSLLEETNRRYDKTLKGFRRTIRNMYVQITDLFNQTGTNGLAEKWFGAGRGRRLEQYITLPADSLYSCIKIQVTSTKASVNREVEMQTNIALMNLIIQNGQQLLGFTQQFAPQYLPIVAGLLISSIKPIYKKVLQYADSPNPDEGVRILSFLESILPAPEDFGGMAQAAALGQVPPSGGPGTGGAGGAIPNPAPGTPGSEISGRMDDIMRSLGQVNGGLQRVAAQRRNGR